MLDPEFDAVKRAGGVPRTPLEVHGPMPAVVEPEVATCGPHCAVLARAGDPNGAVNVFLRGIDDIEPPCIASTQLASTRSRARRITCVHRMCLVALQGWR